MMMSSWFSVRIIRFSFLMVVSWIVMAFTHEIGHIIGGLCCGGTLAAADLLPWHLPYSLFALDPFPLVTLWAGLVSGVLVPLALAIIIQRNWTWFIANFCTLANGTYIAIAWIAGDNQLDTPKLLEQGASPIAIGLYCFLTIGFGYAGFRQSCIVALTAPTVRIGEQASAVSVQSDAHIAPLVRDEDR